MGRNGVLGSQGTSIYDIFVKVQVDSGNMLISYFSKEHILEDLFTKALQGD